MADKQTTYPVFQIVRDVVQVDVDTEDVITIAQATRLAGEIGLEAQSMSGIMRKMDKGDLPTYYLGDPRVFPEGDKLTSRKAVAALPKAKGERVHSQKKVYSPSYGTLLPLRTILMSVFAPFNRFSFS